MKADKEMEKYIQKRLDRHRTIITDGPFESTFHMGAAHALEDLVSILTDSELSDLNQREKEKSKCHCADNQGGPCAACMEERYGL